MNGAAGCGPAIIKRGLISTKTAQVTSNRPLWPEELAGTESSWLLRDFLELGALPSAVPCARHHARQILWEWHLSELSDLAELVISELVTNAVVASRATGLALAVRLWLLSDTARVLVLVGDGSSRSPERAELAADAEGGRGLLLVEAVSTQWGWHHDHNGGKVVWAEICEQVTPDT